MRIFIFRSHNTRISLDIGGFDILAHFILRPGAADAVEALADASFITLTCNAGRAL